MRLRRDDPDTWCNLGAVYAHMGLELESEEACREAIALDPQHAKARFNLAYLLLRHPPLKRLLTTLQPLAAVAGGSLHPPAKRRGRG